jgi:hypothetical protein
MRVALALLLLSAAAAASPPEPDVVEVPPTPAGKWCEFQTQAGRQLVLKCAKASEWRLVDDGAQLTVLGDVAVFSASQVGRYKVVAVCDGKLRLVAVTVGTPEPGPVIPPPKPADPLKARLKAAFEKDGGAAEGAKRLAALYRQAAKLAADREVPSTAELLRRVREAGATLAEGLRETRTVAGAEMRAALGKSTEEPLTDAERSAAAALFARLAEILEGF